LKTTFVNIDSQDLLTDDEIISDSYDIKEIDGVAYEADCRKITVGGEQFGTLSTRVEHVSGLRN
jgi:hypothetical protein